MRTSDSRLMQPCWWFARVTTTAALLVASLTASCDSESAGGNSVGYGWGIAQPRPPRLKVMVGPWELKDKETAHIYPDLMLPTDITCAVVALDDGPVQVLSIADEVVLPPWEFPEGVRLDCIAPDGVTACQDYHAWQKLGLRATLPARQPFLLRRVDTTGQWSGRWTFRVETDDGHIYFNVQLEKE